MSKFMRSDRERESKETGSVGFAITGIECITLPHHIYNFHKGNHKSICLSPNGNDNDFEGRIIDFLFLFTSWRK